MADFVGPLTVAYDRDVEAHGKDGAYEMLRRRLLDLQRTGDLARDDAIEVSFRIRYADVLARFDYEVVQRFKAMLRFAAGPDVHCDVAPGRYAMPVKVRRDGGNDLAFYVVDGFPDDRLAHLRLLKRLTGSKETLVPLRQVAGVFARLARFGPDNAARLARTLGRCGKCGATVTSLASRRRRAGAWCARHDPGDGEPVTPRLAVIRGRKS